MSTAQGGDKVELELLPKELYGNVPKPLRPAAEAEVQAMAAPRRGMVEELFHRNVFHICALYVLLCWVVVEIAPPLFHSLRIPGYVTNVIGFVGVLAFPAIMLLAWTRRLPALGGAVTGRAEDDEYAALHIRRQLHRAMIITLTIGVGYLLLGKFLFPAQDEAQESPAKVTDAAPAVQPEQAIPVAAAPATPIAVLAFTGAGDTKDQEYLVNAISEGLPLALASLPQLAVTSGDSSLRFRSGTADAMLVGTELGARYLVEGSVRQGNDRVQVTVQLIDTRDGSQRWTDVLERDPGSASQLRDDVANDVAKALSISTGAEGIHTRRGVRDSNVYDLYLRGREAMRHEDRAGYERAADYFGQALDLEPQSPTIEAGVAAANLGMVRHGYVDPSAGIERARNAAERAQAQDVGLAEARLLLGVIHSRYDWDFASAKRELDRANSLQPNDARVLAERGYVSLATGQIDNATQDLQSALALDPLNSEIVLNLARAQLGGGNLALADAWLRRLLLLDENQKSAHYYLGLVLLAQGDQEGALAEMKREVEPRHRLAGESKVLFAMGRKAESDAALNQLKPMATGHWASGLASVYASRDEPDAALQWLDKAYAQKEEDLRTVRVDPSFHGLANDSRFEDFLRKVGVPG